MSSKQVYEHLYAHRFELFFASLVSILFGSLIVPEKFYFQYLSPILLLLNLLFGLLLMSKQKKAFRIFVVLFFGSLIATGSNPLMGRKAFDGIEYVEIGIYFLFFLVITLQIIKQVWNAQHVDKNVIMGLMCGYISLGLVAFFLLFSIELTHPGSFKGINLEASSGAAIGDSLLYYSYITLMTIGYGEIFPISAIAQKAAILIGLVGQFYLVIITAVVVEKYIRHLHGKEE